MTEETVDMMIGGNSATAVLRQVMNKITEERIVSKIASVKYIHDGDLTVCKATLRNGFQVSGVWDCPDPIAYKRETRERLALMEVKGSIWEMEGYLEMERLYSESRTKA